MSAKLPPRFFLVTIAAAVSLICGQSLAQESRFVPLFDLYRSDNAFGGTSADRIFVDGVEVDSPAAVRAAPDTVLGVGAVWANAVRMELGEIPFALSPFFRHRRFLESGETSTAYGASLSFRLHEGEDDRLDLRATLTRLDASWVAGPVEDVSLRLAYRRTLQDGARFDLGLTGGWRSMVTDGSVSRIGVDAQYRSSFGDFELTTRARFSVRSSDVAGHSGHDAGMGLNLGRDMGPGEAYTRLGVDWAEDSSARSGQPAARSVTTTLAEIGYAWPLDDAGLGRLAIFARHERSNANLALYDATTNTVGFGLRLGF